MEMLDVNDLVKCDPDIHAGVKIQIEAVDVDGGAKIVF